MALKNEIQGPKGYMKTVRDNYLGSTKEMANLALKKYEAEIGITLTKDIVLNDVDEVLLNLIISETSIYNERCEHFVPEVIPYYYTNIYKQSDAAYQETSESIDKLLEIYNKCGDTTYDQENFIHDIFSIVTPMLDYISFSQKQSAKTRVGECLQNHFEKILSICDIPYETQKRKVDNETKMDFIIPSVDCANKTPEHTINIECQTTLKDRFRCTTGKSTKENIKRYLATVTGCNVITDKDNRDFTIHKLKETVIDNDITLVVCKQVKEKIKKLIEDYIDKGKFSEISLDAATKLINELDERIITFEQLIIHDIPNILKYWKSGDK